MFSTTLVTLGIVVAPHVSSPPPAPTPASPQSTCEYSAMINENRYRPVYKCYTADEWSQKQADDAVAQAKENAEFEAFWASVWAWIASNWWKVILWAIGGIVALFIIFCIYDEVDQKRRPWLYDKNGFRKDHWS